MKTFTKRATLEALLKYEHYIIATPNGEHQNVSRDQVTVLVRKAKLIQSPGQMLKDAGWLLLMWVGKNMIYVKADCRDDSVDRPALDKQQEQAP